MDLARRFWPTLALAVFLLTVQTSLSQTPATSRRSPATVSGKVTIKGKPAAGVAVGLRRMESNSIMEVSARAVTDQDGTYRLTNVAEGSYDVNVTAPAYVAADQADSRKMILVTEGENVEGIDFALIRGGVITGKVTDADGRPVIQQQVSVYRADAWEQAAANQRQPIFPMNNAWTDDRGIYRIYGITAGRYKVAVGRADDGLPTPQFTGRASYNRIFHPDVTEPAKAPIIEVREGSEATGIDISLGRQIESYTVSGRMVDETGLPVGGLRFGLSRFGDRYQGVSSFSMANAKGEFTIDGVTVGKYYVSLVSNQPNEFYLQQVLFDVTDRDITDLVVKLSKGASISGFIAIENDDQKAFAKLRGADLTISVSNPAIVGRSSSTTIGPDGSFRVGGLPSGTVNVFLSGLSQPGPLKGFTVARIERDGVIQPPRGFEIKEAEQLSGVRIVMSYGDAVLRGKIEVQNGQLPTGVRYGVRLSKVDDPMWPGSFTQADARGHFIIDGLPTGMYDLFVNITSPDRKPRRPAKQQVSVTSGTTTEVTVTVDLSEPKTPQP